MIKQNKLSLTKKLDGGYLHVKKSPQKDRVKKGGYSDYLNKMKSGSSAKGSSSKGGCDERKKGGSKQSGDRKVVAVKLGTPKKRVSAKKKKEVKGIPDILPQRKVLQSEKPKQIETPKQVEKPNLPEKPKQVEKPKQSEKPKQVETPKQVEKPPTHPKKSPQKVKQTGVKVQGPKPNQVLKKHRVLKRSSGKSRGRRLNKSLTKRRGGSHHKKGKRISVTKTRNLSNKDISTIQSKLKDIRKKSNKEIQAELEKQGVKLSGKSPSIMKDVYMYSQLCGINIKRE